MACGNISICNWKDHQKKVNNIFAVTMKVGLFWLFNTIVPFTDVGTDLFTFLDLLRDGHVMWAILTFAHSSSILESFALTYSNPNLVEETLRLEKELTMS